MNVGYGDNESLASYAQFLKEQSIIEKGTPEEQQLLLFLYTKASQICGDEWCQFSDIETTDEGIEESARLMCQYRILLAKIMHRGDPCGKRNT